jgi:hypothetical protein
MDPMEKGLFKMEKALFRIVFGVGDCAEGVEGFKTAEERQAWREGFGRGAGLYGGDEAWTMTPEELAADPEDPESRYEMQHRAWAKALLETTPA